MYAKTQDDHWLDCVELCLPGTCCRSDHRPRACPRAAQVKLAEPAAPPGSPSPGSSWWCVYWGKQRWHLMMSKKRCQWEKRSYKMFCLTSGLFVFKSDYTSYLSFPTKPSCWWSLSNWSDHYSFIAAFSLCTSLLCCLQRFVSQGDKILCRAKSKREGGQKGVDRHIDAILRRAFLAFS